jgi:hypothetical protein
MSLYTTRNIETRVTYRGGDPVDQTVISLPGCTVRLAPNWLFERMLTPGQGWHIQNELEDLWPLPSYLDLAVIEAARSLAQQGGKLAVGVPRVVTGVALGPAIYAALSLLIQKDPSGRSTFSGFRPFPLPVNGPLVVASRSHAVRDLLAESLIRFQSSQWRLCQFPTYRLTRTGGLEQGVYGRLSRLQRPRPQEIMHTATPIVLYDYWPFAATAKLPQAGAIFAELAENDGRTAVERLHELIERTQPGFVMAIINLNDIEKRRRLAQMGFEFLSAQSAGVSLEAAEGSAPYSTGSRAGAARSAMRGASASGDHLMPSFGDVDRKVPKHVDVTFMALPEESAPSESLAEVFRLLSETHARVPQGSPYPMPLTRAWYVLDHLVGCPISLERAEQLRRRDPREYSLKFRLEKMEHINWDTVPGDIQGLMMLSWPHILELLSRAYADLMQDNPKWWALAETILDAQEPITILLPDRLAAQGLRDELLLEFGWNELESAVRVRSFTEARRNEERSEHIILAGNWKDWQRPILFGCLPRKVDIIGYQYEAFVLDKRLRALQTDIDIAVPASTRTLLSSLLGSQAVQSADNPRRSLDWNAEAVQVARTGASLRWKRATEALQGGSEDEADDVLYEGAADQMAQRLPALTVTDAEDEADELVGAITITFTDNTTLILRTDRELMVLPQGRSSTEQRFPASIEPGDTVLVFTDGEHTDVFATTLARTQHLLQTDSRVIERWRRVLVTLRSKYPPEVRGQGARFCDALETLGCNRDRATMRSWLYGTTMAPDADEDIACMLRLVGTGDESGVLAKLISKEMNEVRKFNRKIGRRLVQRMLQHGAGKPPSDRIDEEIDELLDNAEPRVVAQVGTEMQVPKSHLLRACEEEDA